MKTTKVYNQNGHELLEWRVTDENDDYLILERGGKVLNVPRVILEGMIEKQGATVRDGIALIPETPSVQI